MSEAAQWGILLEDTLAKVYEKKTGLKVEVEPNVIYHSKHKFLAANIDRWVDGKKYILECKTTGFMKSKQWGEEYTDQIPESYLCQVAHYAAVCDVPKIDIAVLIGGQDFRIYTYTRNREFEDKIIKIACNFWNNHVLKGIPPEAKSIYEVSALYPNANETTVEADSEISQKIATLKELKAEEKNISEAIKKLQFEIQNFMKDADVLIDTNGECLATWKNTKSRISFNSKFLQKEHAEIYDQCISEVPGSRVFLIK
jgi:predicted phage-related endonuclease